MTTTTDNTITIRLSEAPPVRIRRDAWPIIAEAKWHDGKVECQANHVRSIRVRQNADGRTIVYGWLDSGPGGVPAGWRGAHAGWILPRTDPTRGPSRATDEEITRAIRRVAGVIGDDSLADECIADLPAKDLDEPTQSDATELAEKALLDSIQAVAEAARELHEDKDLRGKGLSGWIVSEGNMEALGTALRGWTAASEALLRAEMRGAK